MWVPPESLRTVLLGGSYMTKVPGTPLALALFGFGVVSWSL